jgi:hypothetical protein
VVTVLSVSVSSSDLPFDLTLLPEAETLSQHLFSSLSWSTVGPNGFSSTSVSPLGPELAATAALGAVVGLWLVFSMG